MKKIPFALACLLASSTLFAANGTFSGNATQNWSPSVTTGWQDGIVAEGAGNIAYINRSAWTKTIVLNLVSDTTIGAILVDGSPGSSRKFGVETTNGSKLILDGNGTAAEISNTGHGHAQFDVSIVLNSDLNLYANPTTPAGVPLNAYMGFGAGFSISNSDDTVLRTITTLPTADSPADQQYFRVALSGDVTGNIAIRHNSGNALNLQSTAKSFYGGLYIQSGTVRSSGLGVDGLGAANNRIVFEAADVGAREGVLEFTGNISGARATITQTIELESTGRISVSLSSAALTITQAGRISGVGDLVKLGAGILCLTNNNTYTGNTIISQGTLALGVNNAISSASTLVMDGGIFNAANFSQSFNALALQANATINLGDSGLNQLLFGDSAAMDWDSFTVNFIGEFEDGYSVRFGTDGNSLTAEQIAKISINGQQAYLWNNGYLGTTIPEPAATAALLGACALLLVARARRR